MFRGLSPGGTHFKIFVMYVNFKISATRMDQSFLPEANKKEIIAIECPINVRQAMVFIRHGEPINNEQDVNIPVNYVVPEVGDVHEVFNGGAVRHIQTARAISQKIGIESRPLEWLNEYDLGGYKKKDFESKHNKIDNDHVLKNIAALEIGHPCAKVGNETLDEFFYRNKSGLDRLIWHVQQKLNDDPSYKVFLVTSSGNLGFIELLLTSGGTFSDWPQKGKAYQYLQSKRFFSLS